MESSSFVLLCCTDPQNAPSEVDGVNLEEIREFAKAFKIRRLSLGLTQTQVGQALSATEGPAYSQSAICRYGGLTTCLLISILKHIDIECEDLLGVR